MTPEPLAIEPATPAPEERETILEELPEDLEPLAPAGEAPQAPTRTPESQGAPTTEGEQPPLETKAEPAAPEHPPETRTSDDVRKELRQFLNGVMEKLDEAPAGGTAVPESPAGPADLLDYLEKLSDYLPDREKQLFLGSEERLAMESLKSKLAGRKGLRQAIAERFPAGASGRKEPLTRPLVVDTFSYLKDLAAWHPDKAVGDAMRERMESLVARMRGAG